VSILFFGLAQMMAVMLMLMMVAAHSAVDGIKAARHLADADDRGMAAGFSEDKIVEVSEEPNRGRDPRNRFEPRTESNLEPIRT
jgi:hypothetical protein